MRSIATWRYTTLSQEAHADNFRMMLAEHYVCWQEQGRNASSREWRRSGKVGSELTVHSLNLDTEALAY